MKKKLLGWLAMATMLVGTGCSTDEVVNDYSPENAIQFGTYTGRDAESRGHVIKLDQLKTEGFGVFAYYTENVNFLEANLYPNFMYNQGVKHDSQKGWVYEPVKYWPNTENHLVSFFAYAPWDKNSRFRKF